MTNTEFQDANLDLIHLGKGRHKSAANGMGTMEAVAWLAGERHSDRPDCTCPVIAAYVRPISDWADDEQRQQLRAFLPRLIGSRSADHVVRRAEFLAHQTVTVFLPLMYDELKQPEIAAALRALPPAATPVQFRDSIRSARRSFFAAADASADAAAAAYADTAAAAYADAAAAAYADAAAAAYADAAAASAYAADAAAAAAAYKTTLATTSARNVDRQKFWQAALEALDGALAIGPAGPATLTPAMIERLKTYQRLVEATTAK
jgi:hypothetical protein